MTINNFLSLIGKDISSSEVRFATRDISMLTASVQDLAPDENVRPDHHLTSKECGFQIRHSPLGQIEVIFLYSQGLNGFTQYSGQLEQGLTFSSTVPEIIRALGKPDFQLPQRQIFILGQVGELLRYNRGANMIGYQLALGGQGISLITICAQR